MTTLRVGTRGSDLALWQTRWVVDRLRSTHPALRVEEVIVKTYGDVEADRPFGDDWPVGGFVAAIEKALVSEQVDFAVHSYKDLQTAVTPGLTIAAVPGREVVHDVLVTRQSVDLNSLPPGFRLGTSSPRRAAQFRRATGDKIQIVPIRGNIATRIKKIQDDGLDGTVLAAAGLKRLGLEPPHRIDLPLDRFVPSPAQGALAIQTRENTAVVELIRAIDDLDARKTVDAERSFLRTIGAGCHVPVGALASLERTQVTLRGQLFGGDGIRLAEGTETGEDPFDVGARLASRLIHDLKASA